MTSNDGNPRKMPVGGCATEKSVASDIDGVVGEFKRMSTAERF